MAGFASVEAKEYTFDYHRVVKPDGEISLDLTYLEGDLTVVGNDFGELVVEATKKVHAVSMDEAEVIQGYIEIRFREDGDKVVVTANYLKMRDRGKSFWKKLLGDGGSDSFGEIDWKISVPDDCNVIVTNTRGDMNIGHIRGDVAIRSSAADLVLSSIEGDVHIENGSGSTVGDLLFGNVEVRQPQGTIDLQWIEGDVRIKSSSAGIKVGQERGSIDLTTSTGSVKIRTSLDSSREFFVETESGDINLTIPESASGRLDIWSESGEIKTEMPVTIESMTRKQVVGEFGFGGVRVSLNSISGDVTVAMF